MQDVAAHQLGVDAVGELGVAGLAELVDRFAEGQVGGAREPVEGVEVAADVLTTSRASDSLPRASTVASLTPSGRVCWGEGEFVSDIPAG